MASSSTSCSPKVRGWRRLCSAPSLTGRLARIPYGKTTWTDAQEYLDTMVEMQEGGLLPQPDTCPDDMYAIMSDCWAQDPKARPAVAVSLVETRADYPLAY